MDTKIKNLQELIDKVDQMKKQEKMDLSSDQDLTIAIMNLISIEEHLFFTGAKTGKTEYYDLINEVREMRKELLKKIIKEYEGEVWCISKHLLASSMRVMEVGTKQLGMGNKEEAYEFFNKSYKLYSLFWGLNMKLIAPGSIQTHESESSKANYPESVKTKVDTSASQAKPTSTFMSKLGELVKKAIDCCLE
ncbi:MAG: hypothetical protein NTX86_00740 [Candidatus Dependentiae bacterium]|nr:hypothetical protein [Candidatus Dependentiae bacterium]